MKGVSEHRENDTPQQIVKIAESLFAQIGFQKTTVADIARELRMSPANVYRFFSAKAAINEAVAQKILNAVESAVDAIVAQRGPARAKLRDAIAAVEKQNARRFLDTPKLQELVETAFNENWAVAGEHTRKFDRQLAAIIAEGNAAGEFKAVDAELAAILVRSACVRFWHPRLMVECAQDPEPTIDQMVDFCLAALGRP